MLTTAAATELLEFSEARAYASLAMAQASPAASSLAPSAHAFGSARALVTPQARSTLNMNRVIGLGVAEPVSEETLDAIERLYRGHALSFGVEVTPQARQGVLEAWLKRRRLRKTFNTCMRYRPLGAEACLPAPGVARATTEEECRAFASLCQEVFRVPGAIGDLLVNARHDPRWRHWLVRRDSNIVAGALSFVDQGVAWLGWDVTAPDARGLGLQGALVAARLNDASEAGCRYATSETAADTPARADPSGRNYQKLGFVLAYERTTYVAIQASLEK